MKWQWCRLDELTTREQYAVFAARESVFVVEQACVYQELDGIDFQAFHLLAWQEGSVAAYLRVIEPGIKFKEPSIGRVMTTKPFRGSGLGRQLMEKSIGHIDSLFPGQDVRISAQVYLDAFYRSFGFAASSGAYLEDGIPHIEMLRKSIG